MPLVSAEGLVLQSRNFSETSKILVIFTREHGLISVLVKGGRKGTKKFPGGLETLNRINLQYYDKPNRELQNFKEADLKDSFGNLRNDLAKTYTALSLVETILKCNAVNDPDEDLFDTLVTSFEQLNVSEKNPWTIRWKCLLDISRNLGFGISGDGCGVCGKKEKISLFDYRHGAFICNNHSVEPEQYKKISGEVWGTLKFLMQCRYDTASRINVNRETGITIENLFLQYFRYHIPGLKNLESWKKLPGIFWE